MDKARERIAGIPLWLFPGFAIAVPLLLRLAHFGFHIPADVLRDPDTLMRLAAIRQIMAAGWRQGYFSRVDTPAGMVLHWTKPFNYLLIALIRVLQSFHVRDAALYAGYFIGPLLGMAAGSAAYWSSRSILSPRVALTVALGVVIAPGFRHYFGPAGATHHTLLILGFILMTGFALRLAQRPDRPIAMLAGFVCGGAIWVSPEMLGFSGVLALLLFALWIDEGSDRRKDALGFAVCLSGILSVALLVDPPYGGYRSLVLDRIGIPLFDLATIPLAVILASGMVRPEIRRARLVYFCFSSALLLGTWALFFLFIHDAQIQKPNPVIVTELLPAITENRHVTSLSAIIAVLGNGLAGLALLFWKRSAGRFAAPVICVLIVMAIMGQSAERFSLYFWIAGTVALGWGVELALRQGSNLPAACLAAFTIMGCTLVWPAFVAAPTASAALPRCSLADAMPALNDEEWLGNSGVATVFATEFSAAPAMLYYTPYDVLAGGYHRDVEGVNDSLLFFRSYDERVSHAIARQHRITYVIICDDPGRNSLEAPSHALFVKYRGEANPPWAPTLFKRLEAHDPPEWLEAKPWPQSLHSDLKLFRVRQPGEIP